MKAIIIVLVIFLGLSAAGLIAQGRRGQVGSATEDFGERVLSWEELAAMVAEADPDTYLVDVRTPEEFAAGAIPGAINIPHSRIGSAPPTADPSARIIVYCRSGGRSGAAKAVLEELGYTNVNNFGGIRRWEGELVRPR